MLSLRRHGAPTPSASPSGSGALQAQHQFCDAFKKLMSGLVPYTKEHHIAGVSWNPRGGDVSDFTATAAAPAAAPAAAAPTPAAPAAAPKPAPGGGGGGEGGIADLKNALSGFTTTGLKKVTKDMQTWRSEYKVRSPAGGWGRAVGLGFAASPRANSAQPAGLPRVRPARQRPRPRRRLPRGRS